MKLGRVAFIGVSGPNNAPFVVGFGIAKSPGINVPFGLLNLAPIVLVTNGTTDRFGEAVTPMLIPATLPPGPRAALQGLVNQGQPGGLVLTNPEEVVLVR